MRLVLDACVLYPSVMRATLLTVAKTGAFEPVWSPRLLEEWRRAAARRGAVEGMAARGEIAMLAPDWPKARRADPQSLDRFWLPDENDIHVLALAVETSSDGIVTMNAKDFPRHILAEEGLVRYDPDALLCACLGADDTNVRRAVSSVIKRAQADLPEYSARQILKKARLPRLGKAMDV